MPSDEQCADDRVHFSGGLQPYVAKDLLQFPMAKPSDGLLDLVVQETVRIPLQPLTILADVVVTFDRHREVHS